MDLSSVIEKRTSVRKFKNEDVPVEILKKIAEAGSKAPSINNSQPWKYVAIKNQELLSKMANVVDSKVKSLFKKDLDSSSEVIKKKVEWFSTFFVDVPAVIAIVSKPYKAEADEILTESISHEKLNELRNYPNLQTIGAAVENMLLTTVDLGYGACWLTAPLVAKQELQELLGIQSPEFLVCLVAIGKPFDDVHPKPKKNIDEIFELIS